MSKKSLKDLIDTKTDFKSMSDKELSLCRFVELSKEDYKQLTDELRKRNLI